MKLERSLCSVYIYIVQNLVANRVNMYVHAIKCLMFPHRQFINVDLIVAFVQDLHYHPNIENNILKNNVNISVKEEPLTLKITS